MKISRYCLRDFAPKGTSHVLAFWTQQAICLFLPEHSWKSSSSSLLKLSRSAPKNSALHLWAKNKIQPHHNGTGLISFRKVHDVVKLHTMKLQFTAKSVFTDLIANALALSSMENSNCLIYQCLTVHVSNLLFLPCQYLINWLILDTWLCFNGRVHMSASGKDFLLLICSLTSITCLDNTCCSHSRITGVCVFTTKSIWQE